MAGIDSGGVNERLDGLVALLQSFGIDGVDSGALLEQQKKQSKPTHKKKSTVNISSSDAQILDIVKKLQQAQAASPEIMEALKSPELLALATLAAQKQGTPSPAAKKPQAPSLDDVFDDDDNYPKIGPGYSDEISVVSEMTTPTVMTRQQVADEEYYREVKGGPGALPPMHTAFGAPRATRNARIPPIRSSMGGPPNGKTKNMLGQVRPVAPRRPVPQKPGGGGAAAQRRLNYQMAMSKLESAGFGAHMEAPKSPTPSVASNNSRKKDSSRFSATRSVESGGSASGSTSSSRRKNSTKPKSTKTDIDWGMTDENGWPSFDDGTKAMSQSSPELLVDDDGFFMDDAFASNEKNRRKRGDGSSKSKKKGSREDSDARKSSKTKKDRESKHSSSDRDSSRRAPDRESTRRTKEKTSDKRKGRRA